jgi:hypothetical protein
MTRGRYFTVEHSMQSGRKLPRRCFSCPHCSPSPGEGRLWGHARAAASILSALESPSPTLEPARKGVIFDSRFGDLVGRHLDTSCLVSHSPKGKFLESRRTGISRWRPDRSARSSRPTAAVPEHSLLCGGSTSRCGLARLSPSSESPAAANPL